MKISSKLWIILPLALIMLGVACSNTENPTEVMTSATEVDSTQISVAQGVNQYNSFPSGWKFPFYGSSKITVGYNGSVCGGGYDQYHTGNSRYATDWSRAAGNGDVGDPIPAPAAGWATPHWGNTGYGNYVYVSAGNGYTYIIAHMNQINLNYCGWIERGQVIGTLGCSGNCDGAHIHFVVFKNGVSVPQNGISGQQNLALCGWYTSGQ